MQVIIPLEDVFGPNAQIVEGADGLEVVFPVAEMDVVRRSMGDTVKQLNTWEARDRMAHARASKKNVSNGHGGRRRRGRPRRVEAATV